MYMQWIIYAAIAIAIFLLLVELFKLTHTSGTLHVVENPIVGFANFGGIKYAESVQEDLCAVRSFFSRSVSSKSDIPHCDVLFLYTELSADGDVFGPEKNLRRVAQRASARLLVLASPNPKENVRAAMKREGPKHAAVIITLDRKGTAFPKLFSRIFGLMKEGKTMTEAWCDLAPQIPPREAPDMVFGTEGVLLAFK